MNKNKAIFLDRDGTINVEKNYLYRKEDFEFIPGVIEALQMLQDCGYRLIIVTNQSGIARGYYSEQDLVLLNDWLKETLYNKGIIIDNIYYCPHLPDAIVPQYRISCNCRKPNLGLYERAIKEYDLDLSQCYAIGDKIRDCNICMNSGCNGYLIGDNEKTDIIKEVQKGSYANIKYKKSLYDSAINIASMNSKN